MLISTLYFQLDNMSKDGLYDEFVELMQVAGGIDRKKTVKTLTKLLDMEKTFDVSKKC